MRDVIGLAWGGRGRRQLALLLHLFTIISFAIPAVAQSNGVVREVWFDIGGVAVSDLTNSAAFPSSPSFDDVLTSGFETPTDAYDNFGQRLRALLIPPTTGDYYFLIASDDSSQLFISTNDSPAEKRFIAQVDGWTPSRKYHYQTSQKSAAVSLIAGQRYYLEALMKEGSGGDNLAVAWQKPGDPEPADDSAPIPNANLVPYGVGPPVFTVHPASAVVVEGGSTNFAVQLSRSSGVSFQWVRNGTNIPGATSATLALGPLKLADNGSSFYCRAVNSYGTTNSSPATLNVTADTTRPTISYVQCFGEPTLVTVGFSELIDPISASAAGNYFINNGVSILSAALMSDGATVLLKTTPLAWGTTYMLTVSNIRDLAQTPNVIIPSTQRTFTFTYTPLPVQYLIGTNEPAGPSSRRTPLAITEIMYQPTNRVDGKNLEFIEIYNSNPWPEDLTGHRISGDVGYSFPAGTTIPALGYRVVAAVPSDVQAVYGIANVLGPLTNSTPGNSTNVLDNGGGTVRLRDELNALLLDVHYDDEGAWPLAADGTGHSLVLGRPSYGEGDPQAWVASQRMGGSPGGYDTFATFVTRSVVINEVLAHTDPPLEDYIELFNYSSSSVDVSGCVLTDDPATNRFRIPAGTTIPARGFRAFTQTQLGFALNADGETIYFIAADGMRAIDVLRFGDQENGVALGRFPDGANAFRRLAGVTMGTNNARALLSDVVINEIQYHPASEDDGEEFVEIYNRGSNTVALGKWRLSGGISFTFPTNTTLSPGGYLVVAGNVSKLLGSHPTLNPALILGSFSGKMANGGDTVRLDKPDDLVSTNQIGQLITNLIHIVVDEATYKTGGRWGRWADGGGSSLERIDPRSSGNLAPNWADSDEAGKSAWTTVEFTGVLDNGGMANADQLHLFLLGAGECLVDNVEVIPQGGGNIVANGTFDAGLDGWSVQGTHQDSYWQSSGGYSGACLHVVASDRGDTGANRIRADLTQVPEPGSTATLRAKVRWLEGHPEILLRLHGNWLEAAGDLLTTRDFGSPGARNTRYATNAGPAITEVSHWPVLPGAGQPVTVTARMDDQDGIAQAVIKYRVDPASNYVTVAMTYNGAGFYSGVLPGQSAGVRTPFYIEARDAYFPVAVSRFPADAPARECLVAFGETAPSGSFGAYRLWVSQRNVSRWATREKQSNHPLDGTFVYGGFRAWYNIGTLYSGSPWHTPGYNSPDGNLCDYEVNFPNDETFLGTDDFLLATVGNLNSDPSYQGEQTALWISRKLGTAYLNRRYIRLFFNGQQRSTVYEDAQQPDGNVVSMFFPEDDQGSLHKIEDWFEFDNSGDNKMGNVDATLQDFTTIGGAKKSARYRWNWRPRSTQEHGGAFTNLFALVDAMNHPQPDLYQTWVSGLVNVDDFMRVLAMERIAGNWDSYGYARGKNMFAYKPENSSWVMLPWDIDFVFSSGGTGTSDPLFGSNEPVIDTFRAHPEFQRAYWRAFEDAVNGPLLPAALNARLDPRYSALVAAGVGPESPQALKDYAAQRRSFILSQLATVASTFTVSPSVTVSNGMGVLQGTAPVGIETVSVNGQPWAVRWTSVNNWIATVPLQTGGNFFSVVGLNDDGQIAAGASNGVSLTYNVPLPSPVGAVVINEIMFNPAVAGAEFVELFNTSTTNAFDLSGWTFNGLSYTFPNGALIAPRGFLVLTKDRSAFSSAYGQAINVYDEYPGNLQSDGETLTLLKPAAAPGTFSVVDQVRYEARVPWALTSPGVSLQLRDAAQDNSRVANWAVGQSPGGQVQSSVLVAYTNLWKYMSVSNLDGVNWAAPNFNDAAWPSGRGLLAWEDNPAITPLANTFLNPPALATNNAASGHAYYFRAKVVISNNPALYTFNSSAYLDDGAVFYVNGIEAKRIRIVDGVGVTNLTLTTGQPPGGDATTPDVFVLDASWFHAGTNVIAVEVHQNAYTSSDVTFGLQLTADPSPLAEATPGAVNSVVTTLPAFPSLWLNEAQPENLTGPLDNAAQREPWVELFNPGAGAINLGGFYLSDTFTDLTRWAFPSNITVSAGVFAQVWCDAQAGQTVPGSPHAGFRLAAGAGQIALSRLVNNTIQIVDYLAYTNLAANWSYGDLPDAQPFYREAMFQFTPGATNSPASPPLNVFINEWMADNIINHFDPADNNYEDWFEIYNPGPGIADLGGFYFTDNPTNKFQFLVPDNGHYRIPPGGFLLVWADDETGQNNTNRPDLHVDFGLSKGGESIGLYAADGTRIDLVTFGPQTNDVSEGRFGDGMPGVYAMVVPTPGTANVLPNTAPALAPVSNQEVTLGQTLTFAVSASDTNVPAQMLTFSLGAGAPPGAFINPISGQIAWTPANAPSTNLFEILVTDNGQPSLSDHQMVQVIVHLPPTIGVQLDGSQMELNWPRGMLQEADEATGPYWDVTDQSPLTVDLTEARKFYRVRL